MDILTHTLTLNMEGYYLYNKGYELYKNKNNIDYETSNNEHELLNKKIDDFSKFDFEKEDDFLEQFYNEDHGGYEINIYRSGPRDKITSVVIRGNEKNENKGLTGIGIAECADDDHCDRNVGEALAVARARKNFLYKWLKRKKKQIEIMIEEELNKTIEYIEFMDKKYHLNRSARDLGDSYELPRFSLEKVLK